MQVQFEGEFGQTRNHLPRAFLPLHDPEVPRLSSDKPDSCSYNTPCRNKGKWRRARTCGEMLGARCSENVLRTTGPPDMAGEDCCKNAPSNRHLFQKSLHKGSRIFCGSFSCVIPVDSVSKTFFRDRTCKFAGLRDVCQVLPC